ncbi:ATP-dependent DNA helicase 2 subunit 2 [Pseudohyphozyma bogoriensis]|nr:ATP-dependent DNA helicase 2 subunit 2 [Pseudohyphozyma bogoriensis]
MSLGSREVAVFVVDAGMSMGQQQRMAVAAGQIERLVTPLEVSLQYVKAKIVHRILRDLKTTPLSVITYGVPKTRNVLTSKAKRNDDYSPDDDVYRHYFEDIEMTFTPEGSMIKYLDEKVVAGKGPDAAGTGWTADAHTAIILACSTIENEAKCKNYAKKEIYLLTNGESASDWSDWKATAKHMNDVGVSLTVIGFNFDDEEIDLVVEGKSDVKQENEKILNEFAEYLTADSVVATTSRAIDAMAIPKIREVDSQKNRTTLTLGDPEQYPDSSFTIQIDVKKAASQASMKSMKKMSFHGFKRARNQDYGTQSQLQSESQHPSQSQRGGADGFGGGGGSYNADASQAFGSTFDPLRATQQISMGNVGKSLEMVLREAGFAVNEDGEPDFDPHNVDRETVYYYRQPEVPEKGKEGEKRGSGGDEDEEEEDEDEGLRPTGNAELQDAYYYGGTLIETGDLEEGTGILKQKTNGMDIIRFIKMKDIRYDWRMNDPLYVYVPAGQTGSQTAFSALLHAMNETKTAAIVRYVGKGMNLKGIFRYPDPKIGILFPVIDSPLEYAHWIQMPLAEDIRDFQFASLIHLFNRKGVAVKEHKNIPTDEMQSAMDDFVDSMDLTTADDGGEEEEEEEDEKPAKKPRISTFFDIEDSFSPAIHNVENTLVFRISNMTGELPAVPTVLTKYLAPPPEVVSRSAEARQKAAKLLDVKLVPPKPKNIMKKKVDNFVGEEDQAVDLGDLFSNVTSTAAVASNLPDSWAVPNPAAGGAGGRASQASQKPMVPSSASPKKAVKEEEEMDVDAEESNGKKVGNDVEMSDDDEESEIEVAEPDTEEEDEGEESGDATISSTDLVGSFKRVVKAKGAATAVKSVFPVIQEVVEKSFSTARYQVAVDGIKAAREASEGEPMLFNDSLRTLVKTLRSNPKKKDFVSWVAKDGGAGLVGGSAAEEEEFRELLAA